MRFGGAVMTALRVVRAHVVAARVLLGELQQLLDQRAVDAGDVASHQSVQLGTRVDRLLAAAEAAADDVLAVDQAKPAGESEVSSGGPGDPFAGFKRLELRIVEPAQIAAAGPSCPKCGACSRSCASQHPEWPSLKDSFRCSKCDHVFEVRP